MRDREGLKSGIKEQLGNKEDVERKGQDEERRPGALIGEKKRDYPLYVQQQQ